MTTFGRVIDTDRCIGCRSCVAACHVENHYTPDAPWNTMVEHEVGRYPHARTVFTTMGCMHCEDAPCKAVCDAIGVEAISKNDYGVVLIDYDKCIGCQYCSAVCPYGAPQYSERTAEALYENGEKTPYELIPEGQRNAAHQKKDRTVQKCHFCWHKLEKAINDGKPELIGKVGEYTPSCDLVCPVDARVFGDLDDPESLVSQWIGERKAGQLKKEFGAGPQVYYVKDGGDF